MSKKSVCYLAVISFLQLYLFSFPQYLWIKFGKPVLPGYPGVARKIFNKIYCDKPVGGQDAIEEKLFHKRYLCR